jgi:membrane protein YdbS with pleckstrin-like domain
MIGITGYERCNMTRAKLSAAEAALFAIMLLVLWAKAAEALLEGYFGIAFALISSSSTAAVVIACVVVLILIRKGR